MGRQSLITKILHLKQSTQSNKKKLLSTSQNLIKNIEKISLNITKTLSSFIKTCDLVLKDLFLLSSISEKQFYTPIESFLLLKNPSLLFSLESPKLTIFPISDFFQISLSTFPHSLYNFCNETIGFHAKDYITSYPGSKILKINPFSSSSRCLLVSPNKLMVTGGGFNEEFGYETTTINLETKEIEVLDNLNINRKWHCMA